jgi:glycosyltransferase involved in cell wall biosynthesis
VRFSIVVPNYNSGAVLERALRSLIDQHPSDLEIIVADSASTDVSREIIERLRPDLATVLVEKDHGQADGLNRGFAHARGEIFSWLCADDELLPGTLDHVVDLFRQHPDADVVIGGCERVFADGSTSITRTRPDTWDVIGTWNPVDQPSVFWRADLHRRLGELDVSYHLAFDWDFWCRMRDAGARLVTSEQVLARYFFTDTNKSGNSGRQHVRESFRIVRRYGPLRGWLAYVFLFLYYAFDLHGCYDQPPTCSKPRAVLFAVSRGILRRTIGARLLFSYNWHFASCQERGLRWW